MRQMDEELTGSEWKRSANSSLISTTRCNLAVLAHVWVWRQSRPIPNSSHPIANFGQFWTYGQ